MESTQESENGDKNKGQYVKYALTYMYLMRLSYNLTRSLGCVFFGTSSVIHQKGLNQGKCNRWDINKLAEGRKHLQSLMNTVTDLLVPQRTSKLFAS